MSFFRDKAAPDETTEAFHARTRTLTKAQGQMIIIVGHEDNAKPRKAAPP